MTKRPHRRHTAIGIGVSLAAHAAIFIVLSLEGMQPEAPPIAERKPMAIRVLPSVASPVQPVTPDTPEPLPEPETATPDPVKPAVQPPPIREAKLALPQPQRALPPRPTTPPPPPPPPAAPAAPQPATVASAPEKGAPTSTLGDAENWEGRVIARLEQRKRYPGAAIRQQLQDVIYVRLTVDRVGKITQSRIVKSRGHVPLDNAVKDLIARANPLPPLPDSILGSSYSFVVPIDFFIR